MKRRQPNCQLTALGGGAGIGARWPSAPRAASLPAPSAVAVRVGGMRERIQPSQR